MLIGAGTVLNEEQVNLTAEAGGGFIISPDINEAVIRRTVARGLVSIPGALTPSEITSAHRAGADFVKLFPIADLGINYVKSVRAPLSHIRLLAVGGINTQNISDYLKAGVCGFGIGSNIIDKEMLQRGDFKGIEALARDYTEAVKV
jgi:2-dehydro-3-deoxyphosphogluconate aldolase/(4S)-4-hydroxy-2-oxoglutarate aldolase